jgi:hypothetical protein
MKTRSKLGVLALILGLGMAVGLSGCKTAAAPPLAPGAYSQLDMQINAVLQAGHAAAIKYETDVTAGFVPSAAFKTTMQQLVNSLNIADPLYQQYHAVLATNATALEPPALSAAVTGVSNSLTAITNQAGK